MPLSVPRCSRAGVLSVCDFIFIILGVLLLFLIVVVILYSAIRLFYDKSSFFLSLSPSFSLSISVFSLSFSLSLPFSISASVFVSVSDRLVFPPVTN